MNNMYMYLFEHLFQFFWIYTRVKLLYHKAILCLLFRGTIKLLLQQTIYTPTAGVLSYSV